MNITKKNSKYGQLIELKFENEEEYNKLIQSLNNIIDILKEHNDDVKHEKNLIYDIERLKKINEDGNISTVIFTDSFYDLFFIMLNTMSIAEGLNKVNKAQHKIVELQHKTLEEFSELVSKTSSLNKDKIETNNDSENNNYIFE